MYVYAALPTIAKRGRGITFFEKLSPAVRHRCCMKLTHEFVPARGPARARLAVGSGRLPRGLSLCRDPSCVAPGSVPGFYAQEAKFLGESRDSPEARPPDVLGGWSLCSREVGAAETPLTSSSPTRGRQGPLQHRRPPEVLLRTPGRTLLG